MQDILERIEKRLTRGQSMLFALRNGIFYGIGFVIGSTVVTAVVVSFLLSVFGDTLLGDVITWFAARGAR